MEGREEGALGQEEPWIVGRLPIQETCASQAGVAPPFSKGAEAGFLGQVLKKGALGGAPKVASLVDARTSSFM